MNSLLLLFACVNAASCYKILCLMPVPSKSHNHLAKGIVDALLNAGHEVTWGTPFPDSKPVPNLSIIDISETKAIVKEVDVINRQLMPFSVVFEFAANISMMAATNPAVKEALVKNQYDAVVSEWFFSDVDAGYAAVQQVPWILLGGTMIHPHVERLVDEVRSLSTVPIMMNGFPIPMTFLQRLQNVFMFCMMWINTVWLQETTVTANYKEYFGPLAAARGVDLPPFKDALNNVSILFVNSHPSIAPAQSLPPNVVDIAGYHINSAKTPLPKDLKDILDASKQGFVYFSMGSVLKSSKLAPSLRKALLDVFRELPYTVLWKFEEQLEGLPKNVHIRPWMPQASILAHPNIKVFITHGGLLSTLEAVHYGVPLLAVPVFGDQPSNAVRAERNGFALKVAFTDEMAPELGEKLKIMLSDDKYYKRAKYLSKIFNNRPVPPSKLIPYYVELAIETKGAPHLKSKTFLYSWYEIWMLDILAFIAGILLALVLIIRAGYRFLFGKKKSSKVKKN